MRVEVADRGRIDPGVTQRCAHAARGAVAVLAGGGHVVGVGTGAEAGQLGVDARAASAGVLVLLQHQDAGAVAEHEAVAPGVPRARGALGFVVAGGHGLHRAEAAHRGRRGAALGATGDHHVGIAVLDHAHGHADGVVGGGAGRHRREIGALEAADDAQLARQHVDDGAGHVERRDLARPALQELGRLLLDAEDAANARTDDRSDAVGIGLGDFQARIVQGHERGRQSVVDERLHLLRVLGRHEGGGIEIADLPGDAGGEAGGVEMGDRTDAGTAVDHTLPGAGQVVAQRRDRAHAGDDDATVAHGWLLVCLGMPGRMKRRAGVASTGRRVAPDTHGAARSGPVRCVTPRAGVAARGACTHQLLTCVLM